MVIKNLLKKICCVFLVLVFCMPLVFLLGCTQDDEDNKPNITIAYKPYAGLSAGLLSKTYGEEVYDNIIDISTQILTSLVDSYGQGSNNDGILFKRATNPSLNNVSLASLLGNSTMGVAQQKEYAQEINKMCYASYSSKLKIEGLTGFDELLNVPNLTISKNGSGLSRVDICSLILRLNPANALLAEAINLLGVSLPTLNFVYFSSSNEEYIIQTENCFVFLGGKVGGVNYCPTGSGNYSNTVNFITRLMNTNYNVIEKDFAGVEFGSSYVEGQNRDFNFSKWYYNLFNGSISNFFTYNTANQYITNFVNKYALTFAVEVAKIKLAGEDNLPNYNITISKQDIPTKFSIKEGEYNLNNLYSTAQTGSEQNKQQFLQVASVFIDHYGLTQYEATNLYETIKTKVIGVNTFDNSELTSTYKNNYDIYINFGSFLEDGEEVPSVLKLVQLNNSQQVILDFITIKNASVVEEQAINGYIKSVLFYFLEDVQKQAQTFMLEITNPNTTSLNYLFMLRCFNPDNELNLDEAYYTNINTNLDESNGFVIDILSDELLNYSQISKFSSSITSTNFAYNKTKFQKDTSTYYNAWYYISEDNSSFVEFVFASPNIFTLQHFDISILAVGFD